MAKHHPFPRSPLQGEQPQPGPVGSVPQQGKRLPMSIPNRSCGVEGGIRAPPIPITLLDADERDSAVLRDSVKLI